MTDSIHQLAHTSIGASTATVLVAPDHTTQIMAIVVQLISLLLVLFGKRKSNNN